MVKVVVASLNAKGAREAEHSAVGEKRVQAADGRQMVLRTLDAASPSFGDDLQYVFGRNVARARRDNKRALGSVDLVPSER